MNMLSVYLLAARPKTLPAALVPVLVGTACAYREGFTDWPIFVCILFSAMFIQIGTNFANDYADHKSGADAKRVGPTRVTQSGLLSPAAVKRAANFCFALAFVLGVPLMMKGGWPIVVIGIASLICGWLYTSGPYPLGYNGLGELFVLLFFGFAAVMGTSYLLTGAWSRLSVIAALVPGLHASALLAANNFRDRATDQHAAKRTLAVRFGETFARSECIAFLLLPFLIPPLLWLLFDFSAWIMTPLFALQGTLQTVTIFWRETTPERIQIGFLGTARTMTVFGLLFALALAFA